MGLPLRHLNKGQASVTQPAVFWPSPCVISQDGKRLGGAGWMDTEMLYMLMCPREGLVCSQRAQPHYSGSKIQSPYNFQSDKNTRHIFFF